MATTAPPPAPSAGSTALTDLGQAFTAGNIGSVATGLLGAWGNAYNAATGAPAATTGTSVASALVGNPSWLGNGALILLGIVMGLGALMIGAKSTIIKVGDTATKAAALVS